MERSPSKSVTSSSSNCRNLQRQDFDGACSMLGRGRFYSSVRTFSLAPCQPLVRRAPRFLRSEAFNPAPASSAFPYRVNGLPANLTLTGLVSRSACDRPEVILANLKCLSIRTVIVNLPSLTYGQTQAHGNHF